ncbi:MAG TPA: energy transducer TonB [Steroidobacteraceae bacterium]|nr:energy transducer TonB [Steroidobacteraceae bacterium]
MAAYARHDTAFFSQRAVFFVAIVIVHLALIYLFESGLATRIIHAAEPPLETNIVQDVKQRDAPPPPPPPKMERPPVEVPPPDVVINVPVETQSTAITNTTTKHVEAPPPPPRAPDVRTPMRLDVKHSPSTDDYYPPTSRRMNETGSATIDVCLDDSGKMAGEPKVQKSSGSSRLDEAAVRWGSHARFQQGTLNGKPVAGCTAFLVTFRLTD